MFYDYVIVTEGDSDRAFYQEINIRLLKYGNRGIPNCLFLNAHNKQAEKLIIKPLRKLGIPIIGIIDVDILKEGGKVWTSYLDSIFIPELEHEGLANTRLKLNNKFKGLEKEGKDMKKDGGINLLSNEDKEAAESLFSKLSEYGIFTVPYGELESWLKELGVSKPKNKWIIEIFEKMGEDPENENYIKPKNDDVWLFMDKIREWFLNSDRKGMPE